MAKARLPINVEKAIKDIERSLDHKRPIVVGTKRHSRWSSGICQMCGEFFQMITFEHANKHGFARPEDMAKNGNIKCLDF